MISQWHVIRSHGIIENKQPVKSLRGRLSSSAFVYVWGVAWEPQWEPTSFPLELNTESLFADESTRLCGYFIVFQNVI